MSHQPLGGSGVAKTSLDSNDGTLVPLPSKEHPSEATSSPISKHISTIVASVATLISAAVIVFFAVMAWRRFRVTHQCRAALEKSGLPCFHKTKEMADKDKANKGNFYTVTPKLNLTSLYVYIRGYWDSAGDPLQRTERTTRPMARPPSATLTTNLTTWTNKTSSF